MYCNNVNSLPWRGLSKDLSASNWRFDGQAWEFSHWVVSLHCRKDVK